MARMDRKWCGLAVLLCGMAAAQPQAQVQTGISGSSTGATTTAIPSSKPKVRKPKPQAGTQPAMSNPSSTRPNQPPFQLQQGQQVQPKPQAQAQPNQPAAQVQPTLPPQPQRPGDMPPVTPRISFQNGLLTIQAPNSTLSDVLNGVRSKAGIQFEGSQGAFDRVALTLGPAPANEVLSSLLRGSRFDYVIIGAADNPDVVERVILTPRAGTSAPAAVAGNAVPEPQNPNQPNAAEGGDEENDEQNNTPAEVVQPPPPQPQVQPQQQQQGEPGSPKTTEQLLEELKQMQQQQQQQQGQQQPQEPSPLKTGVPNLPPVRRTPP